MPPLASLPLSRPPLYPAAYRPLPLGRVRPLGWLRDLLRLQAAGVTGHLPEVWPDLCDSSAWLGGTGGEDWERGPYYCDGLIPLAFLLDDPALRALASRWVECALASADGRGQFGPRTNPDWWSRMIMTKVLAQWHEATGDSRALDLLLRFFRFQLDSLDERPLREWAWARGQENLLTALHVYNLTGEPWLLDLADRLIAGSADWTHLLAEGGVEEWLRPGAPSMQTHGVNVAMGVKAPAITGLRTGEERHARGARRAVEYLLARHGRPDGLFSSDENLHGTAPTTGAELCAIVEFMYSLEEALRVTGDAFFADALERAAYNALPAAMTPDLWGHQYCSQINQPLCSVAERPWSNCRPWTNLYGLEPNFGCCTANLHQGWPKFVRHMILATPEGGLAVALHGPCEAEADVAGGGARVRLRVDTEYPFGETLRLRLSLTAPARFPLRIRAPWWAEGAQVMAPGGGEVAALPGAFCELTREWNDGDEVRVWFPMRPRLETGHRGMISVLAGPLLFGLRIEERWRRIAGKPPVADWEIWPGSPWNYGLALDPARPVDSQIRIERTVLADAPAADSEESAAPRTPFAPECAPLRARVAGRRIPEWKMEGANAGEIAAGPYESAEPEEELTLLPFGATRLRIAAFPLVRGRESVNSKEKKARKGR